MATATAREILESYEWDSMTSQVEEIRRRLDLLSETMGRRIHTDQVVDEALVNVGISITAMRSKITRIKEKYQSHDTKR